MPDRPRYAYFPPVIGQGDIDSFIAHWRSTGASELANTQSFGRIDCYKRDCFILEAKQGSEGGSLADI